MPETIVFFLSTARTGTKTLAEGLATDELLSPHQPAFSRLLTIASNFYLHGWLPRRLLEWLVSQTRESQILKAKCRYYAQVFSLDYLPAKIMSERHANVYIVHIVRDPRTWVRSYLNWMRTRRKSWIANNFVPGWHPSGAFTGEMTWRAWRQLDEFQRVCWHWSYKNRLLERLFADDPRYICIHFEDLFSSQGTHLLRETLTFVGLPYRSEYAAMLNKPKNRSQASTLAKWDEWEPRRQQQLIEICGEQMNEYGYLEEIM
jgi:hypothetical protein